MKVPEGLHDDRIMSLGLACWGLSQRIPYKEMTEAMIEQKRERRLKPTAGIKVRMTSY